MAKQAFLAHVVENNLKFSYANPLKYIKENYHVYLNIDCPELANSEQK